MPVAMVEPTKRMGVSYTLEHMASLAMAAICTISLETMTYSPLGGGGGVYSYMQAKSMPSLIAGATLGSLYGLSAYLPHTL
jgi:S-ribosylhomocysteine lyase LuxS involved in autoinducer biosynthesis